MNVPSKIPILIPTKDQYLDLDKTIPQPMYKGFNKKKWLIIV